MSSSLSVYVFWLVFVKGHEITDMTGRENNFSRVAPVQRSPSLGSDDEFKKKRKTEQDSDCNNS